MAGDDTPKPDADAIREESMMYGDGETKKELLEKYPNKPHNFAKTLPFHELYLSLFNPLNDNKKKPTGPAVARRKLGPHGQAQTPHEARQNLIQRFIGRWRTQVGNDIYPAFRLMVPEKDRDRAMYGLKEMSLGKLLIQIMKIDKNSDDGYNLTHWKLPGLKSSSAMAGDFAGRCFEVISKRPMRVNAGEMTIAEVNEMLDRLSVAQKEENQRPILQEFYNRMNAEELTWLIRIILRQMKIGATERTLFHLWHPDAENLYNISSNLRRVCWELWDSKMRLEGDACGINLMQCFQPQLAAFQMRSMEQMVTKMKVTEEDPVFWIEEKLDGERMQMHMMEDESVPGGMRFCFWSRKAKDYTYLYGTGFEDETSALTRHIKKCFNPGVRNIILDGEMITWDPVQKAIVPFGTLKTAALSEQNNPYSTGKRPLYRVFDCLYLNDKDLTKHTLRNRREALSASVQDAEMRLEVHKYHEAERAPEIDELLRKVVAESNEGLVLKNPRSSYRLNDRNDDWIKVKPEYMSEFGEELDCIVIGGYYGSGRRGGAISSFLCGLRTSKELYDKMFMNRPDMFPQNPMHCLSFCKVGGGFAAADYADIRHRTDGKWMDYDSKKPPKNWITLGGWQKDRQYEIPDVWIKPSDSIVISIKAASISGSEQFALGATLRFPRFKKLKTDKSWEQALSTQELFALKYRVEGEREEKKFKIDDDRRKRNTTKRKREVIIQGQDNDLTTAYAGPTTKVFEGMNFLIMTEALKPKKKSKADLEQLVKANGGNIVASEKDPKTILIADRNLVKVASMQKKDQRNLIRPSWLLDCVKQSEIDIGRPSLLLPLEPHHLFYTTTAEAGNFDNNVDEYGDSYTRDVTADELLELFNKMPAKYEEDDDDLDMNDLIQELELDAIPGRMFYGKNVYFDNASAESITLVKFAGGKMADMLESGDITHVVVSKNTKNLRDIRRTAAGQQNPPRIVTENWVTESWLEKTLLDEERFAPL